jgi:hypothetical protein
MSESRDILAQVIDDRQVFTGDSVLNLNTGRRFVAELEEIADRELNTELGRDAREEVFVRVEDRTAMAEIDITTRLLVTLNGVDVALMVLRRSDNPVSLQTEFGCTKLIPGKDS